MTKKRVRILLIALATLLICVALIVAGTYALFSDSAKVSNHLQAGTLNITLTRNNLTTYNLDAEGVMKTGGSTDAEDFTGVNKTNLFGFDDEEVVVPGSWFRADMTLKNNGNVAFNYWITIVVTSESVALLDQVQVEVTVGGATYTQKLSEGLSIGDAATGINTVVAGASENFSVKISFLNDTNSVNNLAQGQEATFDMIVNAVQAAN